MAHVKGQARLSRSRGGDYFMYFIMFFFGIIFAIPLYYTVLNSFKPLNELSIFPPRFYVVNPTTEHYTLMLRLLSSSKIPFSRYLFNTIFITIVGTVGSIIIASVAAYPLAKHEFAGKSFLYNVIVWAMMFSGEVTSIPSYLIVTGLGLYNTYWSIFLPNWSGTGNVFLMRQFMEANIPGAVVEAAKIDGSNEWNIYWRIVMPNVKPAWLTLIIFNFGGYWGSGAGYINIEEMKLLPTAIGQITSAGMTRAGAGCAVGVFMLVPPLILFLFSQSAIMETMSTAGLK
ncbi:MAG: carbohydrate ABC transporter permease [Clostridia bacterium]|nr:carbohydrate ABC transporter permease [Clostridia bacterium]